MPPESNGATPQPDSQSAGTLATNQGSTGTQQQQQIDPQAFQRLQTEYATTKRQLEQANGMRPFYEKAKNYGLKDEATLEEVGKFYQTATKRGFTPRQLASMFEDEKTGSGEQTPMSREAIEQMLEERAAKMERDFATKQAEKEWESQLHAEYDELEDEAFYNSLQGETPSKELTELMRFAALGKHQLSRTRLGDDHPLKGRYAPAGKEGLGGIKKWLTDTYGAVKANKILAAGAAVNKSAASTPAGNGANGGKPDQNPQAQRPGGLPSRQAAEAKLAEIQARRGGR